MASRTCGRLCLLTIAAVILQAVGVVVFVLGFFPIKPTLPGVSGAESFRSPTHDSVESFNASGVPPHRLRSVYQELSEVPPPFDRMIFMVVDGLPAEFVIGKDAQLPSKSSMAAMPYSQSLLSNGMAIGYHAKAAPPTVTMPRLKAMVSGAIGGFLDVAFNFNTQALLEDNLLDQFHTIGWKMVMLGDDTWLKLFPGLFTRHDGVSSFFVKDTVQVDKNVSRHLMDELNRDDWNILILHYLGLDHVGHIGGRNSALMTPKLKEMDEVVKMIHLSTMLPQKQGRTLLMLVSDHGMTESGNHGGSSFEETDSLVLFVFPRSTISSGASAAPKTVCQVDITPTLALLLGVPIPKNSVGVLIEAAFSSLADDQKLRAMELNSWQLFRLIQAQLPGLSCPSFPSDYCNYDKESTVPECSGTMDEILCCLYKNAVFLHNSFRSKKTSSYNTSEDYSSIAASYHKFLRTASEWLSHRATDMPLSLLAFGVSAMLASVLSIWILLYDLCSEVYAGEDHIFVGLTDSMKGWHLDDTFIFITILVLLFSMGSSSLVEEEQYIWHYVTSTYYLFFFRKTIQSFPALMAQSSANLTKEVTKRSYIQMSCIALFLISGRILRGWHQGGVNWTYFPDISRWLIQAGGRYVKLTRIISGISLNCLSLSVLSFMKSNRKFVLVVGFIFLAPGLLVLQQIMEFEDLTLAASCFEETLMAQFIYSCLGFLNICAVVTLPWIMPAFETYSCHNTGLLEGLRDCTQVIGWVYVFSWCLLQLLLQQPVNSMPILLLFVQILATLFYYSYGGAVHKQWVEVVALYYLGMAGHFGLGNSNTLATIDVAGAFIGISRHSTLLSGILMFIITFASPMLVFLSLVLYISMADTRHHLIPPNAELGCLLKRMLGVPCLVPLALNSVLLTTYTVVLLLMQNHLFVWSVFSPKYLYVCMTTVCVYFGVFIIAATMLYICVVFVTWRKMQDSAQKDTIKCLMH